jgi:16S rRNA processing protein RimM
VTSTAPAGAWDDFVVVGVVARTQGNRGEVVVNASTDFPERRFVAGAVLHARRTGSLDVEQLTVRSARMHLGRPVLAFEGVDTMGEAEPLAGAELRLPPETQHALPAGVYYHSQLIGCAVITENGATIGRVTAVDGQGGQSRLVIRGSRGELLIPLAEAICPVVDVEQRRIVVRPPEGLLDLNDVGFSGGSSAVRGGEAGSNGA